MAAWELVWGIGILVLAVALAWALVRYKTRNKANDRVTEEATAELYQHPDTYDQKRPELEKQLQDRR